MGVYLPGAAQQRTNQGAQLTGLCCMISGGGAGGG